MQQVLLATIPGVIALTHFFGFGTLVNILWASILALSFESLALKLRKRPLGFYLKDCSALVTAVLLGIALPPYSPWWLIAVGMAAAILMAKHLYGGLGYNPFNPAMAGYVVLLISFPEVMTRWLPPAGVAPDAPVLGVLETLRVTLTGTLPDGLAWDAVTGATPLDDVKTQVGLARTVQEATAAPLYGDLGARGWEWVANWTALGGLYLLWRKIIRWQIPVAFILGLCVPATLFWLLDPGVHPSPAFHLFSGAAMLGAFFIATDPVSAATSPSGRIVYGAGIGLLVFVIREWGGYPDAEGYGVLLMNMAVPAIDHFTRPRTYGHAG
jgi:electron transport complex protein RnfD